MITTAQAIAACSLCLFVGIFIGAMLQITIIVERKDKKRD